MDMNLIPPSGYQAQLLELGNQGETGYGIKEHC